MNPDNLTSATFQAQFSHASKIQQKSQLVAFYLKNYIITKAVEFLKFERSQGKDISAMMEDVRTWFQDLEILKQSLGYQLQNEEGSKRQYYEFMAYQFSRCDAQYKNKAYSQQLADEFSSIILLTEAYCAFNSFDQQVEDMKNQAQAAYNTIINAIQTDPRYQPKALPTYSNFSRPPVQDTGAVYHGHQLETPNPDSPSFVPGPSGASTNQYQAGGNFSSKLSGFQPAESVFVPKASLDQRKDANNASTLNRTNQSIAQQGGPQNIYGGQSAYQDQHIRTPEPEPQMQGGGALAGFQMVESSYVSKDGLNQNKSLAQQSQQRYPGNMQSQNKVQGQSMAGMPASNLNAAFKPVESGMMPQNPLNQLKTNSQDEELIKLDDLLASLKQGTGQSTQNLQSQHQNQGGRVGASAYKIGQSTHPADSNQPAFSGFQMAESNYVPKGSIGQNQNISNSKALPQGMGGFPQNNNVVGNSQQAFSGFQMAESGYVSKDAIAQNRNAPNNANIPQGMGGGFSQMNNIVPSNQQAFSGFQMAESGYVSKDAIGQNRAPQGIAGNFSQNNQFQANLQEGIPQNYNPNFGNLNNPLPDFTKITHGPSAIPSQDGSAAHLNASYQPFNFKQSSHPNPGQNIPNPGFGFPVIPGVKIEDSVAFNPHSAQGNFTGQPTSLPQNTLANPGRQAEESKRETGKPQPSRLGGAPSTGPPLNLPSDKYNILKEMCRMAISELDYKNVQEAKDNLRKALDIIKQYNP